MYVDSDRMQLYRYMKAMLYALLDNATVCNISDDLDRGVLQSLVVPGDLVYVQGWHVFSDVQPSPGGAAIWVGTDRRRSDYHVDQ